MVIFRSYVSWPEGTVYKGTMNGIRHSWTMNGISMGYIVIYVYPYPNMTWSQRKSLWDNVISIIYIYAYIYIYTWITTKGISYLWHIDGILNIWYSWDIDAILNIEIDGIFSWEPRWKMHRIWMEFILILILFGYSSTIHGILMEYSWGKAGF